MADVRERGRGALERVVAVRGREIPFDAMAELIDLGRRDEGVRGDILAEVERQLWNPERDMALAWLCLVAGEVGRDGLRALIELLGKTESDDLAEAAIPTLVRHALEVYQDIKVTIEGSTVTDQRRSLYETLDGAAVLGDAELKGDLVEYARGRLERELEQPARSREVLGPLRLLVALGAPDARAQIAKVRKRTRGRELKPDLEEQESYLLDSKEDPLEVTRLILKDGWRDTAENLRKLFHPTAEEEQQLRELAARFGAPLRGVH